MQNNWSLVIHEVGCEQVKISIGTLFPNERKFDEFHVDILKNKHVIQHISILKADFSKPFSGHNKRFYKTILVQGLTPSTEYTVKFLAESQIINGIQYPKNVLSTGTFSTLPTQLKYGDKPFVVALGSCFYYNDDGNRAASAYQALRHANNPAIKPDVKFLVGDQVYLDIGLDSLSPRPVEITSRIADDYAHTWQSLKAMLSNGGTWMLADDHEFWNDYPQISSANPYLWMLKTSTIAKRTWKKAARDGVKNVQNITPIRTFKIGDELSFCIADLRSHRTTHNFLTNNTFKQLIAWAESLTTPGVLVLSQPLMVKANQHGEKNLANFKRQYTRLLLALASSGHDIVVLTGDAHFGRIGSVTLGTNGCTLHEIISSPLSNLSGTFGVDGEIAASIAEKIDFFPNQIIGNQTIGKLTPQKVKYPHNWCIESEQMGRWYQPGFNYQQTQEHLFTIAFSKHWDGRIKLEVQAWRIRQQYKNNLPHQEFTTAHEFYLA